jgi:hypothetical protein
VPFTCARWDRSIPGDHGVHSATTRHMPSSCLLGSSTRYRLGQEVATGKLEG